MGYMSHLRGDLTITPPMPDRVGKGPSGQDYPLLYWTREQRQATATIAETGETAEAAVTVIVGAEPYDDACKAYDFAAELSDAVAQIRAEGRQITGTIVREGENQGDVERWIVGAEGEIQNDKAQLTWPDGSAVKW